MDPKIVAYAHIYTQCQPEDYYITVAIQPTFQSFPEANHLLKVKGSGVASPRSRLTRARMQKRSSFVINFNDLDEVLSGKDRMNL